MPIRQLPDFVINQIAAGEVIERPASVVKELTENALDAGADDIRIVTRSGGLGLISVADNGSGIARDELALAVARHCTSKLPGAADDIRFLGFRGEALPSIGSVSQLTVTTRRMGDAEGSRIVVALGRAGAAGPAPANPGTVVDVEDLFANVPARLKFMRSQAAENSAIADAVRRIALARPDAGFTYSGDQPGELRMPGGTGEDMLARRVRQVLGDDFADSAIDIDGEREGVRLYGLASPASMNRANGRMQFVHVNGRPVRDRQILGAIAGAYSDRLPRGRHAMAVLYIEIDPALVDVNVHPAKADVRFREPGLVRGLIVAALRAALDRAGLTVNHAASRSLALAFQGTHARAPSPGWQMPLGVMPPSARGGEAAPPDHFGEEVETAYAAAPGGSGFSNADAAPQGRLGAARAQLHRNYIVAQTEDGMVLVDQHAAHERLVYEELKQAAAGRIVPSQRLLIPEVVTLAPPDATRLLAEAEMLETLGLIIEPFGDGAIAINAVPAALSSADAGAILRDAADELAASGRSTSLQSRLDAVASRIACHGSVRAGRDMRIEEMNALLRRMEATPGSDTCNHGRPTFVALQLADIERLFQRR